jgi:hypothetical protein
MKKVIFIFLLVFAAAAVYSQTGIIREFTGEVELKPAGSSVFIPAQPGSTVTQDTIVSTGFRSTAIIVAGSNVITVQPLTRLSLAEISRSANTENLSVNLQAGRIRADVKPPAGTKANTTVQSPSATASVRGTVFEMDTNSLDVIEGSVKLKGFSGISSNVPAGFQGSVDMSRGDVITYVDIATDNTTVPAPVGLGATGKNAGPSTDFTNTPVKDGEVGVTIDW